MSALRAGRQHVTRALLVQRSTEATSAAQASLTHPVKCQHAPGSCVLCSKVSTSSGGSVFGRCFSSQESGKTTQDDKKTPKPSGKKTTTSGGGEGGMLGERSGPSKEATPSDKEIQEEAVEERHVKQKKQPETAPWAS